MNDPRTVQEERESILREVRLLINAKLADHGAHSALPNGLDLVIRNLTIGGDALRDELEKVKKSLEEQKAAVVPVPNNTGLEKLEVQIAQIQSRLGVLEQNLNTMASLAASKSDLEASNKKLEDLELRFRNLQAPNGSATVIPVSQPALGVFGAPPH